MFWQSLQAMQLVYTCMQNYDIHVNDVMNLLYNGSLKCSSNSALQNHEQLSLTDKQNYSVAPGDASSNIHNCFNTSVKQCNSGQARPPEQLDEGLATPLTIVAHKRSIG